MRSTAPLLGATGDCDHPGPRRLAQLDPGGAQTAGSRVDNQGLAGLEPSPLEEAQVGRLETEERRGLDVVEAGGCVEHRDAVCDGVLGDAAERVLGDGDHPLAQPRLGALAHRVDHPADVHAQGERRRCRHRNEVPPAAVDVVEVERGRTDLDADLLRSRLGALDRAHRQHLSGRPVARHLQGFHLCHVPSPLFGCHLWCRDDGAPGTGRGYPLRSHLTLGRVGLDAPARSRCADAPRRSRSCHCGPSRPWCCPRRLLRKVPHGGSLR